ncbi:hypothetical protein [Streptomyces xiamenensis]|uniref:hypothetical protein n=1 Tax=Streptomyces xiamenensis TaxID=408015 RepID=UPI0037CCFDC1
MTNPAALARRWPIGLAVSVYPGGGHYADTHWHGVIHEHEDLDVGLVQVRCTDPHGFHNQRMDHVTTVWAPLLRRDEPAKAPAAGRPVSEPGPEQPSLFDDLL